MSAHQTAHNRREPARAGECRRRAGLEKSTRDRGEGREVWAGCHVRQGVPETLALPEPYGVHQTTLSRARAVVEVAIVTLQRNLTSPPRDTH